MTKVSKIPLGEKDLGLCSNELWTAFVLMETKEDIRLLFKDLFTHTEYKMFAKRLQIMKLLMDGEQYDVIREKLKVTPTPIAHISNILATKGEGFRKVYQKLKNLEKDHSRKLEARQNLKERRSRKKLPAETFLFDLAAASFNSLDKAITKHK